MKRRSYAVRTKINFMEWLAKLEACERVVEDETSAAIQKNEACKRLASRLPSLYSVRLGKAFEKICKACGKLKKSVI